MNDNYRAVLCEMLNKQEGTVLLCFLDEKIKQCTDKMLNTNKTEEIFELCSKAKGIKSLEMELISIRDYKEQLEEIKNNG